MELLELANNYVKLAVRAKKLEEQRESAHKIQVSTKYESTRQEYSEIEQQTNSEHSQVVPEMFLALQTYQQAVDGLDDNSLIDFSVIMEEKFKEIQNNIENMTEMRDIADLGRRIAFKSNTFEEEKSFNKIIDDCCHKIENFKLSLDYYSILGNALQNKISKAPEEDFDTKGSTR